MATKKSPVSFSIDLLKMNLKHHKERLKFYSKNIERVMENETAKKTYFMHKDYVDDLNYSISALKNFKFVNFGIVGDMPSVRKGGDAVVFSSAGAKVVKISKVKRAKRNEKK